METNEDVKHLRWLPNCLSIALKGVSRALLIDLAQVNCKLEGLTTTRPTAVWDRTFDPWTNAIKDLQQ